MKCPLAALAPDGIIERGSEFGRPSTVLWLAALPSTSLELGVSECHRSCSLKACVFLPRSLSTSLPTPQVPVLGLCPEEAWITNRRTGNAGAVHVLL